MNSESAMEIKDEHRKEENKEENSSNSNKQAKKMKVSTDDKHPSPSSSSSSSSPSFSLSSSLSSSSLSSTSPIPSSSLPSSPPSSRSSNNSSSNIPSNPSNPTNNNNISNIHTGNNGNNGNISNNNRQDREEDGLFHKQRPVKQETQKITTKKSKSSPSLSSSSHSPSSHSSHSSHSSSSQYSTRLRTQMKPLVRFGSSSSSSPPSPSSSSLLHSSPSSKEEDEEDNGKPNGSPPSSPHPSDDVPLETLLKHGSGWAFPREQNGKMICIFRSCPQPLRGGTKKDYIDHLRLHHTMEHTPLYSMLRHAPPGGLLPPSDTGVDDESQVSQYDGEWEGEDDDAEETDEGASGANTTQGSTNAGGTGEEELHTPKLSQRGLQLRAQMMKYGLNIFRQDSEGRYLCFFMGCTMRMTTNFSRHIAKHEKKLDAISPDLVHLLKEGSTVDKPYSKTDKKAKSDASASVSLVMSSSSHLIPPPLSHLSHSHAMHMEPMHRADIELDPSLLHFHRPSPSMHMQHSMQHMQLQQQPPAQGGPYMQMPPSSHLSSSHLSSHLKSLPPHPHTHPPTHPQQQHYPPQRHPPLSHLSVENPLRALPPNSTSFLSPNPEIQWVYRSPLPSPLSLPLPPRRPSLGPEAELSPVSLSPKKFPQQHSFPPLGSSPSPSPRPSLLSLSRIPNEDSEITLPLKSSHEHLQTSSSIHPSSSFSSDLPPQQLGGSDLGSVATSLLDLRKM